MPILATEGMSGLGLKRQGQMVAGVLYEGFSGSTVWMHVAAEPGRRWMSRDYLRACFAYPFEQLGVNAVRGWVNADNHDARRFDEHLGFSCEATLSQAGPGGVDVLIYRMRRQECRFLKD
jgi:RimJ/RimL family protein N-acetyltransferase